jgi:hypothetical protein
MHGRTVENVFEGRLTVGVNKFFLDAATLSSGMYLIVVRTERGETETTKLVVR